MTTPCIIMRRAAMEPLIAIILTLGYVLLALGHLLEMFQVH